MKKILKKCAALFLFAIILYGCSSNIPLSSTDPRIVEISQKFAANCFETASPDINTTFIELKDILNNEIYMGGTTVATNKGNLKDIETGYNLTSYPADSGTASAIVVKAIPASLKKFVIAETWDKMMEVFAGRYTTYERTYTEGDKTAFINDTIDTLKCSNHIIDIGQRGISFEYINLMTFTRYKGEGLPAEGIVQECMYMPNEAVNVSGKYNARMSKLYSVITYIPIDGENTYRVVTSWVKAGGGLFIFNADANSGDVGQGINDDSVGITAFVTNPANFN